MPINPPAWIENMGYKAQAYVIERAIVVVAKYSQDITDPLKKSLLSSLATNLWFLARELEKLAVPKED